MSRAATTSRLRAAPAETAERTGRASATAANSEVADAVRLACKLLNTAKSVVVLAHLQPDADALGSALALGLALSRRGTDVAVSFDSPAEVPDSLTGLPGQHLVRRPGDLPQRPELLVTVDVNSAGRLGSLIGLIDAAANTLVIDHHSSNTRFGSHHLVDVQAESTTVLVARILDMLGAPIDADIAANLYAGLATDSVGFRHASSTAHRMAARWLEAGVHPDSLMRPITDTHPFGWLSMVSTVLARARLLPTARPEVVLVWTSITLEDGEGMRSEEFDSVIDIIRTTGQAPVAAVFKQSGPDRWQVSLRSRPPVDVSVVATELGGGGHPRASGYGFDGPVEQGAAQLAEVLGRL